MTLMLGAEAEEFTPAVPTQAYAEYINGITHVDISDYEADEPEVIEVERKEVPRDITTDDDNPVREPDVSGGWTTVTATAYTADCAGCIGITKSGVDVRNTTHHEGKRVIAVDPAHIPLGSTVELRYADGRTEMAIAADTGGAIKGAKIDILRSSTGKAIQFGRQQVEVRVIN